METTPLISIIIPVFNTEKYLDVCFQSLVNQSLQDWECLMIDDGSSDKSGEICDSWAAKDYRFKAYHKQNGGQASARNVGLNEAKGRYIMFLDSDDKICNGNLMESLLSLLNSNENIDFIQYSIRAYSNSGALVYSKEVEDIIELNTTSEIVDYFAKKTISVYVCDKIFRITDKFKKLKFPEGVYYEDERFIMDVCNISDKMIITPLGYYYYLQREGSTTHQTFDLRHTKDLFKKDFHGVEFALGYPNQRKLYLEYIKGAFKEYKNAQLLSDKEELKEYKRELLRHLPVWMELLDNTSTFSFQDKISMSMVKVFGFYPLLFLIKLKKRIHRR